MASIPQGSAQSHSSTNEGNNTIPLIIVTILFFMWGSITSLNDILIPHLKGVYSLGYAQASLVQVWFFGAYFLVSLPAGFYVRSFGYQKGAITGLIIAAIGCALFYPAAGSSFNFFLFAFFIMAAGITVLQVAANPYVAVLGPAKTASSRLTLTQAINSSGTWLAPTFIGPIILGGVTFLTATELAQLSEAEQQTRKLAEAAAVQGPYLVLAATLLILAVLFAIVKLPKIDSGSNDSTEPFSFKSFIPAMVSLKAGVKANPHLALGVIGIFVYVGAEVSIGSYLVNFFGLPEIAGMREVDAAKYLGFYWFSAMVGRFIGFAVMRVIRPGVVLGFCALMCISLVLFATLTHGKTAMWAIIAVGLFNSIMFPTIFTMALHKLGGFTSQGSGLLCMGIVGGAIVPFMQGLLADAIGLQLSFLLPAICYIFILYYGFKYANMLSSDEGKHEQTEPAHV